MKDCGIEWEYLEQVQVLMDCTAKQLPPSVQLFQHELKPLVDADALQSHEHF